MHRHASNSDTEVAHAAWDTSSGERDEPAQDRDDDRDPDVRRGEQHRRHREDEPSQDPEAPLPRGGRDRQVDRVGALAADEPGELSADDRGEGEQVGARADERRDEPVEEPRDPAEHERDEPGRDRRGHDEHEPQHEPQDVRDDEREAEQDEETWPPKVVVDGDRDRVAGQLGRRLDPSGQRVRIANQIPRSTPLCRRWW